MPPSLRSTPSARRRSRLAARLVLEPLEQRQVRSGATLMIPTGAEPNDTVDLALELGRLADSGGAEAVGSIGDGAAGASDVDWYGFAIDRPTRVVVDAGELTGGAPFRAVVGLYRNDPYDYLDPFDPTGHLLLAQDVGGGSDDPARVERVLGPGTYRVAVSGAGNRDFHPRLAASGLAGEVGDYDLRIATAAVAADGPAVLAVDPSPGAVLDRSPFAVRFTLGRPIDPATIIPDETVRLIYNPEGTFGDEGDRLVLLAGINASADGELQLFPLAPLAPGHYRVVLAGEAAEGRPVLADLDGVPLGTSPDHPAGRDHMSEFRVEGVEGDSGGLGNDTAATARDLGEIADGSLIRIEGSIGDDPYHNPTQVDDLGFPLNPANDVDVHRFRVVGEGQFAFVAEVYAGRIGSPLDPGISLFRIDADGALHFVAGNNNSQNPTRATDGSAVLLTDSVLHAALTAGEYILVVSSGFNTPSPLEDLPADADGLFDPLRSHSGRNGITTGPYVLGLRVFSTPTAPRLLESSPSAGTVLDRPPTHLSVRFSEPVNVRLLAFQASRQASQSIPAVYVEGADSTRYFPRFESYDASTNTATFLMLDGLPDGSYVLHLSGQAGLAGLGSLPIDGDGPDGDAVVSFRVDGPERFLERDSSGGYIVNDRAGSEDEPDLGVLFPRELEAGITFVSEVPATTDGLGDPADGFRFRVLRPATYDFTLDGEGLPDGVRMTLLDDRGNPMPIGLNHDRTGFFARLDPGIYRFRIEGPEADPTAGFAYRLQLGVLEVSDNAPPLADGPAPSLLLRLGSLPVTSPPAPPTAPVIPAPATAPGIPATAPGSPAEADATPSTATPDVPAFGGATPSKETPDVLAPATALGGAAASTATPAFSGPATGSGSPSEGVASLGAASTPLSPGGLIALSVAPIGSLDENAGPFAPVAAQVAFTLPSPPPSVPSMREALARLVIGIQGRAGHDPADSGGPIVGALGGEVSGPALVFEGLKSVAGLAPVPVQAADAAANLEPTPADPPATPGAEDAASVEPLLSEGAPLPGAAAEEMAEDVGSPTRLATLAWVAGLASLATTLYLRISRYRAARAGRIAGSNSDRSSRDPEPMTEDFTAEGRPGLATPGVRLGRPSPAPRIGWQVA